MAQTSYFKGDFKWAKSQLKILKSSTTQLIANDAVDLFLIISDNEPKDSIPSGLIDFAKADLLAYQNKNIEAIATYNKILEKYQGQNIEDETMFNQAAIYLKEKQYDKAMELIIQSQKDNPYLGYHYYLLTSYYASKGLADSALYYAKKTYFQRPRALAYYQNLVSIAAMSRDSATIDSAFKIFIKYRNEAPAWASYIRYSIESKRHIDKSFNEFFAIYNGYISLTSTKSSPTKSL